MSWNQKILLASASRDATTNSDPQVNVGRWGGVLLQINITGGAGIDSVIVQVGIQTRNPVTEAWGTLAAVFRLATVGGASYIFGQGGHVDMVLPYLWRASVIHNGAGAVEYSLSAHMLR